MNFARIDTAMSACKAHLDATGARNTEIESFLVGYLLTVACAEYEQRVEALVAKRAERTRDGHVHNFVKMAVHRLIRSPDIGAISGVLGQFDAACKTAFQAAIIGKPPHASYDNIVRNRQSLSHSTGTQMTFGDLEKATKDCELLFDEIANALGLTPAEIDAI